VHGKSRVYTPPCNMKAVLAAPVAQHPPIRYNIGRLTPSTE